MFFESCPPVLICKGLLKVRQEVLIQLRNDRLTLRSGILIPACAKGVNTLRAGYIEHRAADPELANNEKSTTRESNLFRFSGKCSSLSPLTA